MFHDAQKQPDQSENTVINTKHYFINIGFLKVNQISKKFAVSMAPNPFAVNMDDQKIVWRVEWRTLICDSGDALN